MEPEIKASAPIGGSSKTLWILGLVIIIVVAAGYFLTQRGAGTSTTTTTETSTGGQSIAELLALGTPQTCTFSQNTDSSQSEGTVYFSNGHMRGDFQSIANGQPMISHMLTDGTTAYVWGDGLPSGFKMMMGTQQEGGQTSNGVDINQKQEYNCTPSTPDAALFTLPSSVQFTDVSALGAGAPTGAAQ